MQNRYTADIGDFGKYGLLRALCSPVADGLNARLGVVWYLVLDESHNADGKFTQYLNHSTKNDRRFRQCDPELYDTLADIIQHSKRCVSNIHKFGILPHGTVFYEERLTFDNMPANGLKACRKRTDHRNEWVQGALSATVDCDLIFVDPDNGLEVGIKRHMKLGPKYVFFDELEPYYKRGQSIVIYQHIFRRGTAKEQVRERLAQIDERLNSDSTFALLYHRGAARAFLVVPSEKHKSILTKKVEQFMQGPWSQHFTMVRNR